MNSKRPYEDERDNVYRAKRSRPCPPAANACGQSIHDATIYTIAWICALPLELEASRAMLDEEHRPLPIQPGDDNTYVLGRVDEHNVVMACLPGQYGTNNAAIVATNLKRSFPNVHSTLMVGIGGGCPSQADLYLGDVVVATRVMQYDIGKVVADGCFEEMAEAKTPSRLLNSAVSNLRSKHGRNRSSSRIASLLQNRLPNLSPPKQADHLFQASYEHRLNAPTCDGCDMRNLQVRNPRFSTEPKIHYGVVASGNRVMKHGKTRDEIGHRFAAICFEMESAGMMDNLQCQPIRGICDYSDSHKNKEWQDYAAATAAAYARELLEVLPPSSRELSQPAARFAVTGKADALGTLTHNMNLSSQPEQFETPQKRRQRLTNSLSFPEIDARKTTIQAAHAKTCRWFLFHPAYQSWLDPAMQSQTHGFLWMRGKAGAGKSTMMKFAYLETKRRHIGYQTTFASFFFNARGDYLERSIAGMYRSLLWQLLQSFPNLQKVFDDTDIVPSGQMGCPDLNSLKELLRSAVMDLGHRSATFFIDALDECDEQEVRDMVQYFEDLAETATDETIKLRICFSSRPYPYIDIRRGALLTLEDEAGHAEDLAQYVKTHLRIKNPSLLAEVQVQILKKACGIFMWIVLVVEILNRECSRGALAIKTKLSETPAKLSDLFKSMLMRDQDEPEKLLLCVLWILCAERPLTPAEFYHALWVGLLEEGGQVDLELPDGIHTDDCIRLVTSSSKGLAEITKSHHPTVQFIHESVRDFLVRERGLQILWPDIGFDWEAPSHNKLGRYCFKYLRLPTVRAFVDRLLGSDGGRAWDTVFDKCPFLDYASQQALYHADAAALAIPQDEVLCRFFTSPSWVGILNLFPTHHETYDSDVTPSYVLADRGLANIIPTRMKTELALHLPKQRYKYPLFAALSNGHQAAVAAILGLPVHACNDGTMYFTGPLYSSRTPLSWAAGYGRRDIVEALIRRGADPKESDTGGSCPLIRAVEQRHESTVQLLIETGADLNAQDRSGMTALMAASVQGHEALARLLVEKGANTNAQDELGMSALIAASIYRSEAIVRLLVEKETNINAQDRSGMTALIAASNTGHEAVVRLLVEKGANTNAQDVFGKTALIAASANGHHAIVQLLLEGGADIEAKNDTGETALMMASLFGEEAIAKLLIKNGANLNVQCKAGLTALMAASRNGYHAISQLLIKSGADVNVKNETGKTALMMASHYREETAIAELLIKNGAEINARCKAGLTALMAASRDGYEAIARLLIKTGADVNARDEAGKTALMISSQYREEEAIARLLIENGADINARSTPDGRR